jgi:hypothetical protein
LPPLLGYDGPSSRYGAATLQSVVAAIKTAANGEQERTLNLGAFKIGRLIADRQLPDKAIEAVIAAGLDMASYKANRPWRAREIAYKVNRAIEQGKRVPYRRSSCFETLAQGAPLPNGGFHLG